LQIKLDEEETRVVESLKEEGISEPLCIAFLFDRTEAKPAMSKKFVSNLKKGKIEFKLKKEDKEFIEDMEEIGISAPLTAALLLDRNMEQFFEKGLTKVKMFIPFKNEEDKVKILKTFNLEDEEVKQK